MEVFCLLYSDKCHGNVLMSDKTFMRSCTWIGNSSLCITHVSILFTILSMSDCLGMCFLMIDNGISTGTSG